MHYRPEKPLVVQSDFTVFLETDKPESDEAAEALARFADLVKSPDHLHTYRITPLSLWNAASSGFDADRIVHALETYGKFAVPANVRADIQRFVGRYGLIRMEKAGDKLMLVSDAPSVLDELCRNRTLRVFFGQRVSESAVEVPGEYRGVLKRELIRLGYPVRDLAGYSQGESLPVRLRSVTANGRPFQLRDYQRAAVDALQDGESLHGGSGVAVLPCGAGKTMIGIAALARWQCATLILTANSASVRQWRNEILDKTDLAESLVGEYNGDLKQVRPVTIATYQILTYRRNKEDRFEHMRLFQERDWGLIIYDEVHLLPAPVFRATAGIQAKRRLGLTATLVREDGMEEDVFSLVGPKLYEVGWKQLEKTGWIARVDCTEVRVPMPDSVRMEYAKAEPRHKMRIAGENPRKLEVVRRLISMHRDEPTIVIGHYIRQLQQIADAVGAPLISGETPHDARRELYEKFNRGAIRTLVVSKVADFAVNLPDARVAIQVSGSFGSRQEEAQRLGRILRPKRGDNKAYFYTLVSDGSTEQRFSAHRRLFLVEQGYRYRICDAESCFAPNAEGVPT